MASTQQILQDVESFYRQYIDAFNQQDIEGYARCFAIPYAFVRGGGLALCTDDRELKVLCEQTFIGLRSRGWERSEAKQLRVWLLEKNHAMIVADVWRFKSDGDVLEQGRFGYTAQHDGRNWKILTIFPIAEPYLGPGDVPR
ncbi:MAG: DUF6841 family protein [Candidatus Xenobia bacterium]